MKAGVTHAQVADGADAHKEIDMKRKVVEVRCNAKTKDEYLEFLDGVKNLAVVGERILIVVPDTIKAFTNKIGIECADKYGMKHMLEKNILAEGDDVIYEFIGKMILDYILSDTYYLFSEKEQTLYMIKGDEINESKTTKKDRKPTKKSKLN